MIAVEAIGVYVHVPFCLSKCPYCDFYSLTGWDEETLDAYTHAVIRTMADWDGRVAADTLYLGGGTPSLLGGARIARIVEAARRQFQLTDAEITLEANPGDGLQEVFRAFAAAGGNRVSMGMQAATLPELHALGRRHTPAQVETAVTAAQRAGLSNLSLDMMLGIPLQTSETVRLAVHTAAALGATHISAYLLGIEEGTPFALAPPKIADEDESAALYLDACDALAQAGYAQYEISNFAKNGAYSRHNLKYWAAVPYLGIGPAAHSFWQGKRFAYPRDMAGFLAGEPPVPEENSTIAADGIEEYAMLRLRLTAGLTKADFTARFAVPLPAHWIRAAAELPAHLAMTDEKGIRLTRQGFLLSNQLIAHILFKYCSHTLS